MTDAGYDMSGDSGVSDMTFSDRASSIDTSSTVIASPPSSLTGDRHSHGHSEPGSANFGHTMHEDQSLPSSALSQESGFMTGSGSDSRAQLPGERLDATARTQDWIIKSDFEVFVQDLDGKTVTILVEEDEKVESFKKKVSEKTKVPESQQYMTYAGRKLQDGDRLSSYSIRKHCTILCHGRLRGGY